MAAAARYKISARLGDGAFSEVHQAEDATTGELVALKRVFLKETSEARFPVLPFRELQGHRVLHGCPNVVPVLDHYIDGGCLVLVQPCYSLDLADLLDHVAGRERYAASSRFGLLGTTARDADKGQDEWQPSGFLGSATVRSLMRDVLHGIHGMHSCGLMHRDVKPSNVLLDGHGVAYVGDLGLVRPFVRDDNGDARDGIQYTCQVTSRWYRAPEILSGARCYGPAVDCWAAGAVAVELFTGRPMAPGGSDIEQLSRVFAVRGTPSETSWPDVGRLPDWGKVGFAPTQALPMEHLLPHETGACPHAREVVQGLLALDPSRRLTARQALESSWLSPQGCGCGDGHDDSTSSLATLITQAVEAKVSRRPQQYDPPSDGSDW